MNNACFTGDKSCISNLKEFDGTYADSEVFMGNRLTKIIRMERHMNPHIDKKTYYVITLQDFPWSHPRDRSVSGDTIILLRKGNSILIDQTKTY